MINQLKLYYLANIRLPTEKAHGIQIMKMCEAFADLGLVVELIVPRRLNSIKADAFSYYGVSRNFKITKLPVPDLLIWPNRFTFFLQSAGFLLAAKIYLLNKKFDILYTREAAVGYFFKNFILELHNLPKKISSYKKLLVKAKKIIVLTEATKAELKQALNLEEDILVAPDAVDLNEFDISLTKEQARIKLNLPLAKKIILYSGSFYLYDNKGVGIVLEAAKLFDDNYLFVLVGGGQKEIESIKEKYNFNNLFLVGHQLHSIIPYYLKAADVLLLPNKSGDKMSERYTSPMKLFEYMASGRPIVASALPSIREILNDSNAVLVEPNQPESLAKGIREIIKNNALVEKISKKALEEASYHSWSNRVKEIINFIE